GGTAVSTYFAVKANRQAAEARGHEREATAAREEAEAALVDGLLRPVGREEDRVSPVEADALGRLAGPTNDRLRLRFLDAALAGPQAARRLSRRAPMAAHAAVGLSVGRRRRALALVRARLAEPGVGLRVRVACVAVGAALQDTDEAFGRHALRTV